MIFHDLLWTNEKETKTVAISGKFIERLMTDNPFRCASNGKAGGVVAGKYNERHDLCTVTDVADPSPDSLLDGDGIYIRGHQGVNEWFEALWSEPEQIYYIGEWFWVWGDTEATLRDATRQTLIDIFKADNYNCPEPILIVLSGVFVNRDVRVFTVEDGDLVEFKRAETPINLSVVSIIGGKNAITWEDGLRVYMKLYIEMIPFNRINMSLEGIETLAAPFVNAAFGRLVLEGMPLRYFRENIIIGDTKVNNCILINKVLENSEECRLNPEKLKAIMEALHAGTCSQDSEQYKTESG